MALSDRIRKFRQEAHLSQEKVAELMGVSRQAVTKWEAGTSAPSTENLIRLAQVFEIDLQQLVAEPAQEQENLAQQIFALQQQEKLVQRQKRISNIGSAIFLLLGWIALLLISKVIWLRSAQSFSIAGWLFLMEPGWYEYLFGWTLTSGVFVGCAAVSILPAVFGKVRFSLLTLISFALALPIGELCGKNSAGAAFGFSHYGWLILLLMYLLGCIMGIRLEKKQYPPKSRQMAVFCGIYLGLTVLIVVFVRLSMFSPA